MAEPVEPRSIRASTDDAEFETEARALSATRGASETQVEGEAKPRRRERLRLGPGDRLGRYQLLDELGHGGMGAVYRAYDPELDRIVAIKLVLVGGDRPRAQARLLREAQAIARLSHANVVQVFDVGRDEDGGDVFIAMEFVNGPTLKQWLRTKPARTEILRVFADAAEGLAAAHDEGLVHRDFKPDNVLIAPDGRAKVLDFGLAKAPDDGTHEASSSSRVDEAPPAGHRPEPLPYEPTLNDASDAEDVPSPNETFGSGTYELDPEEAADFSGSSNASNSYGSAARSLSRSERRPLPELTRVGSRVGTPAYMPPEQMGSSPVDGRADQFSFGVALYEALAGHLPFAGSTPESYALSVVEGRVRELPRGLARELSPDLVRAILRMLRPDPNERFANLEPVLAVLRDDPQRRRRRRMALAAGVAAVAVLTVVAFQSGAQRSRAVDPCADAGAPIEVYWDAQRRDDIRAALAALPRSFAAELAPKVATRMDDAATRWRDAAVASCHAETTHAAGGDDSAVIEALDDWSGLRRLCLDRARTEHKNLADSLATPTPEALEHALDVLAELEREVDACADPAHLRRLASSGVAELDDATIRQESILREVEAAQSLASYDQSAEYLATIPSPGPEWTADMRLRWGIAQANQRLFAGEPLAARHVLEDARDRSLGASAPVAAVQWQRSYASILHQRGEIEEMARATELAYALALERFGPDDRLTLTCAAELGVVPYQRGDYDAALEAFTEAETRARRHLPADDELLVELERELGSTLAHLGRYDEGLARLRHAAETRARREGEAHPKSTDTLHALAVAQLQAGRLGDAEASFERVLELMRRDASTLSPLDEAGVVANLAATGLQLDRAEPHPDRLGRIETQLRGALEKLESTVHVDDADGESGAQEIAPIRALLGTCLDRQGRHAEAAAELRRALDEFEATQRGASTNGLMTRLNLGKAERAAGNLAAANSVLRAGMARAKAAENDAIVERYRELLEP